MGKLMRCAQLGTTHRTSIAFDRHSYRFCVLVKKLMQRVLFSKIGLYENHLNFTECYRCSHG